MRTYDKVSSCKQLSNHSEPRVTKAPARKVLAIARQWLRSAVAANGHLNNRYVTINQWSRKAILAE